MILGNSITVARVIVWVSTAAIFWAPLGAWAQEKQVVTEEYTGVYREYQVLAEDTTFKEGYFLELNLMRETQYGTNFLSAVGHYDRNKKDGLWEYYFPQKNQLNARGNYFYGKKTGLWTYYYPDPDYYMLYEVETDQGIGLKPGKINRKIRVKAFYDNGKPVGIWEYFDYEGNLYQKYNHDLGVLTYLQNWTDTLNRPAQFIGGTQEFYATTNKLFNPDSVIAKMHDKVALADGLLTLACTIAEDGSLAGVEVAFDNLRKRKFVKTFTQQLLEAPTMFVPEMRNGQNVVSTAYLHFYLYRKKRNLTVTQVKDDFAYSAKYWWKSYSYEWELEIPSEKERGFEHEEPKELKDYRQQLSAKNILIRN